MWSRSRFVFAVFAALSLALQISSALVLDQSSSDFLSTNRKLHEMGSSMRSVSTRVNLPVSLLVDLARGTSGRADDDDDDDLTGRQRKIKKHERRIRNLKRSLQKHKERPEKHKEKAAAIDQILKAAQYDRDQLAAQEEEVAGVDEPVESEEEAPPLVVIPTGATSAAEAAAEAKAAKAGETAVVKEPCPTLNKTENKTEEASQTENKSEELPRQATPPQEAPYEAPQEAPQMMEPSTTAQVAAKSPSFTTPGPHITVGYALQITIALEGMECSDYSPEVQYAAALAISDAVKDLEPRFFGSTACQNGEFPRQAIIVRDILVPYDMTPQGMASSVELAAYFDKQLQVSYLNNWFANSFDKYLAMSGPGSKVIGVKIVYAKLVATDMQPSIEEDQFVSTTGGLPAEEAAEVPDWLKSAGEIVSTTPM